MFQCIQLYKKRNGYLPCTPKGYMAGEKSLNGSFGNSAEESRFTATVQAAGNFSQCRSLTAMLQKGKGKNHYRYIIPRVNCLPLLNFFSL